MNQTRNDFFDLIGVKRERHRDLLHVGLKHNYLLRFIFSPDGIDSSFDDKPCHSSDKVGPDEYFGF